MHFFRPALLLSLAASIAGTSALTIRADPVTPEDPTSPPSDPTTPTTPEPTTPEPTTPEPTTPDPTEPEPDTLSASLGENDIDIKYWVASSCAATCEAWTSNPSVCDTKDTTLLAQCVSCVEGYYKYSYGDMKFKGDSYSSGPLLDAYADQFCVDYPPTPIEDPVVEDPETSSSAPAGNNPSNPVVTPIINIPPPTVITVTAPGGGVTRITSSSRATSTPSATSSSRVTTSNVVSGAIKVGPSLQVVAALAAALGLVVL